MRTQLAYDAIALEYGGNTVFLRPSLRAAMHLERLHGGFPNLFRKIEEFDTQTIWHVIKESAGKTVTDELFSYVATKPLSGFTQAAQAPCFELLAALLPEASEGDTAAPSDKPMQWGDVFRQLFKIATGWLHWPPETAWNAAPQEITDAYDGHIEMLKAIHGTADETETDKGPSIEQRKQNKELGLDPDFDRAGLFALKGLSELREGMAA